MKCCNVEVATVEYKTLNLALMPPFPPRLRLNILPVEKYVASLHEILDSRSKAKTEYSLKV